MTTAYRYGHFERSKRMFVALALQLDKTQPSAAARGLDASLTVLRSGAQLLEATQMHQRVGRRRVELGDPQNQGSYD